MTQDPTIQEAARMLGRSHASNFERRKPGYGASSGSGQYQGPNPSLAKFLDTTGNDSKTNEGISIGFMRIVMIVGFVLALLSAILLLLAYLMGHEIAQGGHTLNQKPIQIEMGSNLLYIPANLIRFSTERYSGDHKSLEMYMHWPDLAGYTEQNAADFNNLKDMSKIIFLTLEPRTMIYDMSGRIEPIYERYFSGPEEAVGNGLVRRPLSPDGGFIDEYLYFEKDSPYPFAARCVKEGSAIGRPICIRDMSIGNNLSLTYRFEAKYLSEWLKLDQSIRTKIETFMLTSN